MQDIMKNHLLEDVGLTKGETTVYFTLVKVGTTTTGKIIDEAQISAGKVYQILEKLIKKGLVSYVVKEKTKYFSASHPNRLKDFLSEKESEFKEKEDALEKALPSLIQIYGEKQEPHETKLFQGFKGLQSAIFEALQSVKSNDEILAMGINVSKQSHYNILWEKWHAERESRKIHCRCLFSELNDQYSAIFKKFKFTQVRVLKGITPAAITILGSYVLIQTYKNEGSCLVIRNNDIAESFRTFFETLWLNARKI